MKKVIRLTENELVKLIKNVIKEQTGSQIKIDDGKVLINNNTYELVTKVGTVEIDTLNLNRDGSAFIKACFGIMCKEDTLEKPMVDNILTLASKGVVKIDIKNKKGTVDKYLKKI